MNRKETFQYERPPFFLVLLFFFGCEGNPRFSFGFKFCEFFLKNFLFEQKKNQIQKSNCGFFFLCGRCAQKKTYNFIKTFFLFHNLGVDFVFDKFLFVQVCSVYLIKKITTFVVVSRRFMINILQ